MASIKMIDEKETTGKANKIYDQIRESLGMTLSLQICIMEIAPELGAVSSLKTQS